MNLYSPSIYDIYFDDDYVDDDIINSDNNSSDDIINGFLVDEIEVECKKHMESGHPQKIIDLNYDDPPDYKVNVITKIEMLKGYIDITHIDEVSLRFAIYYSRNPCNINNMSIVVFYTNFKIKGLKVSVKNCYTFKEKEKK